MATFDLGQFLDLAFWRAPQPDHPMRDLDEATKLLALLPDDDADASLADITHWAATMNATQTFTPELRGQILMMLDDVARAPWRTLSKRFLAPQGPPLEGRDGDANILRALFGCASEFVNGYAIVLNTAESRADWVEENLARLYLRAMRWLGRRLALAHMLPLPSIAAIWAQLHQLHAAASERKVARSAMPVFDQDRFPSSPSQEYLRALLLELAHPESLIGRQVEFVYRITGRVAASAGLEPAPTAGSPFSVVPAGDSRPGPTQRYGPNIQPAPLYIDTANCLPRLRAMLERDMGRDPSDLDTLFDSAFTLRERRALLDRLLEHWGMDPPRRRSRRVELASAARVISGFDRVVTVTPPLEKGWWPGPGAVRKTLQLELADTTSKLKRAKMRAERVRPARVADASASGLGIGIHRVDAPWARHGALMAILVEPRDDWTIGVLRRIFSEEDELRLGVQVLAKAPRAVWFRTETLKDANVWEEAMMHEDSFREHYKRGILLEPQPVPLAGGDILLPPATAMRGTQLDLPLPDGTQRIRVARVIDDTEHFQRVLFESLGVTKA